MRIIHISLRKSWEKASDTGYSSLFMPVYGFVPQVEHRFQICHPVEDIFRIISEVSNPPMRLWSFLQRCKPGRDRTDLPILREADCGKVVSNETRLLSNDVEQNHPYGDLCGYSLSFSLHTRNVRGQRAMTILIQVQCLDSNQDEAVGNQWKHSRGLSAFCRKVQGRQLPVLVWLMLAALAWV